VETSLDTMLADALRDATGAEIALSNGFRFGTPLAPGTVREKHLTRAWTERHLAPDTLARAAHGWLLFENGMRRIIVTPPPLDWQELDDDALIRLLERDAPRRRRRRRVQP